MLTPRGSAGTAPWPARLPRFGVFGASNSGKTTLVRQLVATLTERGHRVGTVKHATHALALDVAGKDSWLHGDAGASRVLIIGPGMAAGFVHRDAPTELAGWSRFFDGDVDVVLVEGFKRTPMPHVTVEVADVPATALLAAPAAPGSGPALSLRRPPGDAPEGRFPPAIVARLADVVEFLILDPQT
ncbi:MAG: molybdopterin-guanine dinucleotide biosynthesis protein B [Deltaproteobacteria bacterium]|nr:MAG: molybdopterin-guanine dinucleotide biosynthesis protein B [Deltaproteobacteria bacterium]